jgi:aminopeptidase N
MKRLILLCSLLVSAGMYSQNYEKDLYEIVKSESRSAQGRMAYKANLNTQNYDVTYHKLEFTIDPSVASISGVVTTHFVAKEDMTQVTFDLTDNMIVTQVLQGGNALGFTQNANDELVITLSSAVLQNNTGIVEITYSGTPQSSGFDSFETSTHSGDPILWTLSEPYGAKDWWPCKQDLNDKIDSIDIHITTPVNNAQNEAYVAVSNGLEQSQVINGQFKTTHFKHNFPIPAYLVAIAATNYEVYTHVVDNNGNPFEIVNYVYPESLATAQASTPVTVDIMNLFSDLFEEYPYSNEKYGHAQFGWGGGMEHTTVSFMGGFSRGLIAHELAHQWFGDKITCGSWKDIWLNEGFATYLSGLVVEDFDGNAAFTSWKQSKVNSITSQLDGSVYLTDQDTTNVSRIFNGRLSYNKGSMVLHMLRKKIGDVDFYQGIQNYLSNPNHAFGYAKSEDFIPIMETASGEDLSEFFNDWLYNQGHPSYTIGWSQANPAQVRFEVSQTQSHASVSYFEAPIPIRIHGIGGELLDVVLNNTSNNEVFIEPVAFTVTSIEFDPEYDLISKNNSVLLSLEDQLIISNSLKVYPNPVNTLLHIKKPEDLTINSLKIYNLLGQLVEDFNFLETIDVEHLSSGMHFIVFQTNKGVFHKKVLKH